MPNSLPEDDDVYAQQFRVNLKIRLDRLDRGEGIHFESEEALQGFFDRIMTEGQERYDASQKPQS